MEYTTNTTNVSKIEWAGDKHYLALREYEGAAGHHALLVSNMPESALVALASFLASNTKKELVIAFSDALQIVPGTNYYAVAYGGKFQIGI